jgi:dihydroorotate dehydrogenase
VKIAPDMSDEDLDALLEVVREVRLDGVVATNTTVRRDGLRTDAAVVASIGQGGLSGPPLRLRSREVVTRARQKLGPVAAIIGVGGVETGDDARALLAAGANLVQLYTGFVYGGPGTPGAIARGLIGILEREKKAHVGEFVSAIVGEAASLARAARHGPPANEARSSGSAAEP